MTPRHWRNSGARVPSLPLPVSSSAYSPPFFQQMMIFFFTRNIITQRSLREGQRPSAVSGEERPEARMWSERVFWLCVKTSRGCLQSHICHSSILPHFPPPPAVRTPTIHNLHVSDIQMKIQRAVFMPSSHLSDMWVLFFSPALSKSSQSPRPYKSPPSCTLWKHAD